ncbi:hypothetical protein N9Z41_02525 [bacterium]|nr:hypothetical protein [bacterium]
MALVLNTNSYVTIAEADAYFETRIDSAEWESANDDIKEQALVTATQLIDNRPWIGAAVSSSQALAWPRKEAIYYDPRMGQDITVAENEVPSQVKMAVYEQALHLLQNEDLLAQKTQTFESISVGSISVSDANNDVTKTSITPSIIIKPLRVLIRRGSTGGMGSAWWRAN